MASTDVYTMVTDRIVAELENGVIPWKKPWISKEGAISHVTGKPYSLLNQMLLAKAGEWLTYAQAVKEGGKIKKGEKGRFVVFWKWVEKKTGETDADGNLVIEKVPFLRYFTVFHIDQCEGIKPRFEGKASDLTPDAEAQKIFDDYTVREKITVNHGGDRAFYRPFEDSITLPVISAFKAIAEYYSTAFHEAVHSTGAKSRLNRDGVTGLTYFGSEDYSKEELIAEIGSSMILNKIGMETEASFKNNAAYINGWLSVLRNDKRFIVSAAGKAEKAVKFLLNEKDEEIPA